MGEIRAKALVAAAGGFEANLEWLREAWGDAAFRRVIRLLLPRTATLALLQIGSIVTTTVLASTVAGGVAALAYAYQVLLLPIGLLGVSVATATFPTLSAMAGSGEFTAVRDTVRASLRLLLYAGMGGGALLCALASPLVALLFEHGKFGTQEAEAVSLALRWYALAYIMGIPPRDLHLSVPDSMEPIFSALYEKLRSLLETVVPTNLVSLPLKLVQNSIYATAIDHDKYLQNTRMYLAVSAETSEENIIQKVPQLVKVCSATHIDHLVRQAFPALQQRRGGVLHGDGRRRRHVGEEQRQVGELARQRIGGHTVSGPGIRPVTT